MDKIDPQKLNTIFNQLKELVGPQGAFVLYANKGHGEFGEDTQIRTLGPHTKLLGLLSICTQWTQDSLIKRLEDVAQEKPREPD